VFKRSLTNFSGVMPDNVEEFPATAKSEILQTLAIQSGVYSRYRRDQHFPAGSFEAMFSIWMERSIRRELADVVLIIREHELIAGMVTIKKEQTTAKIGLFAVLNVFRRKGMGSQLMDAAYAWALQNDCTELQVVGQIENREACRFYDRKGLDITEIQHAMHLWL
jgi:dTDP-4-amino-4,6-dideoxy-D-galactose acyltransferase